MEGDVARRVEEGDLEGAREAILSVEESIRLEPSLYGKRALMEKVARLKAIYNSRVAEQPAVPLKAPVQFAGRENEVSGVKNKVYVRGVCDEHVSLGRCSEAVIEDCSNVVFEHFRCEKSVLLTNVRDCRVSCSGQQIRMNGCENVELEAHTATGVFLQDSKGVVVRRHGSRSDNKFDHVYDFSNPFGGGSHVVLPG